MAEKEIWRPIKSYGIDYEGIYEVSDLGRVRSLSRLDSNGRPIKGVIMKPNLNKPYPEVSLSKNAKSKTALIHRLVADAFVEGHFEGARVNHIDENKQNNRADNLEWVTVLYNNTYGTRLDRVSNANSIPILGISKYTGSKIILKNALEAEGLGFSSAHISSCISGKLKQHGGFIWGKLDYSTYKSALTWLDEMID
ncbi:HNH homing endonuclease [Lactococcus lactis subsp. lactis]|uniref:Endonuclease n=2 Tax=Lactococcus lactis TaxID=1358 RepID=A0A2A5SIV3_LACLH|nr:NUMOD4 domain-containing protein [Lactococcus lactis]KAA8703599.1 endonuclease [Lactococcus lactis subsp. hordniae]KSU05962.1 HNH homing endonuclease [Lactococcus lactis subsp. lactis]MCT3133964.1 endonuclease [Lactococcus lactis]PCS13404.1 HNH homing endonuclease, Phage intron [Lactococcus lactis subsp. hordniae]